MVPERGSVPLVIQDHPCHTLLHIIMFLWIEEGIEVPLQVSLLSIFLVGLIKCPLQTLLRHLRLLIGVSQKNSNASLKSPPSLPCLFQLSYSFMGDSKISPHIHNFCSHRWSPPPGTIPPLHSPFHQKTTRMQVLKPLQVQRHCSFSFWNLTLAYLHISHTEYSCQNGCHPPSPIFPD